MALTSALGSPDGHGWAFLFGGVRQPSVKVRASAFVARLLSLSSRATPVAAQPFSVRNDQDTHQNMYFVQFIVLIERTKVSTFSCVKYILFQ